MRPILEHIPSGRQGVFVKSYISTGHGEITQIKLDDGRIYYAPSVEFQKLNK